MFYSTPKSTTPALASGQQAAYLPVSGQADPAPSSKRPFMPKFALSFLEMANRDRPLLLSRSLRKIDALGWRLGLIFITSRPDVIVQLVLSALGRIVDVGVARLGRLLGVIINQNKDIQINKETNTICLILFYCTYNSRPLRPPHRARRRSPMATSRPFSSITIRHRPNNSNSSWSTISWHFMVSWLPPPSRRHLLHQLL